MGWRGVIHLLLRSRLLLGENVQLVQMLLYSAISYLFALIQAQHLRIAASG